jgi:hypothetical protein
VPRRRRAQGPRQQVEPIVEAARDPPDAKQVDPRRRQLDRQGHAVQPAANVGDRRHIRVAQLVFAQHRRGPLDEELNCREAECLGGVERRSRERTSQRVQPVHALALDPQRFTAGRQDPYPRRAPQNRDNQRGSGVDDMLAIVENQQRLFVLERRDQMPERIIRVKFAPEDAGEPARNQAGIGDRCQIDQPDAVFEGWD